MDLTELVNSANPEKLQITHRGYYTFMEVHGVAHGAHTTCLMYLQKAFNFKLGVDTVSKPAVARLERIHNTFWTEHIQPQLEYNS